MLDRDFPALSDPSQRQMIGPLARGPASVSELARPLRMTLASIVQHVQVLEASGLVASRKTGRLGDCPVKESPRPAVEQWFTDRRTVWQGRLDRLDAVLDEQAQFDVPPQTPTRGFTR